MKFKFSLSRLIEQVAVVEYEAESLDEAQELINEVDWDEVADEVGASWEDYGVHEYAIVTHIDEEYI